MPDRDRLIELLDDFGDDILLCDICKRPSEDCDGCKNEQLADYLLANGVFILPEDLRATEDFSISAFIEAMQMYKEKDRYIKPPCKVGDKVAVRACCECVTTIPDNDECRYICPFEDDCDCEDCDNANERIFNTEISSIFNDGLGWKITFKNLSLVEASFSDIGISFFVGENAEQQAKDYEQALKECEGK